MPTQPLRRRLGRLLMVAIAAAMLVGLAAPRQAGAQAMATEQFAEELYGSGGSNCWACGMFEAAFKAGSMLMGAVYREVADDALTLLGAGMLVWMVFFIGKQLISPTEIDPIDLWKQVGIRCAWAIFAAAFLGMTVVGTGGGGGGGGGLPVNDPNWEVAIFEYTLEPIVLVSVGLGEAVLNSAADLSAARQPCSYDLSATPPPPQVMSPGVGDAVKCLINDMSRFVSGGLIVGYTLVELSCQDCWLPDFGMLFAGLFLVIIFGIILVVFPLYLLDSIIRIGIMGVLAPVLVVAWVFESTRQYVKQAFQMVIHAGFTLVIMCVILALSGTVVIQTISNGEGLGASIGVSTPEEAADPNQVAQRVQSRADVIEEDFNLTGTEFLELVALGVITVYMVGKAEGLAGQFAQIAAGTGGTMQAASLAKSVAVTAALAAATGGKYLALKAAGGAAAMAQKATAKMSSGDG